MEEPSPPMSHPSYSLSPLGLEDTHLDIIGKACRGRNWTREELARRAGLPLSQLAGIEAGEILPEALTAIADALGLGAKALLVSARKDWYPAPVAVPGLRMFTSDFDGMLVNSFLVWDEGSKEATVFDTGSDVSDLLAFAASRGLRVVLILITHTHGDHLFDLDRLVEKTGAPAYVGEGEPPVEGLRPFPPGKVFRVGSLSIATRLTRGHAEGGVTYVVTGLQRPVAVVGDALFAGSMGGGVVSWADALRTAREEILSLPGETVLACGHGPLTTVAEEREHNPFFAD